MATDYVQTIRDEVNRLENGLNRWSQVKNDPNYDKKNVGFNIDSRFAGSHPMEIRLDSWVGSYGSSSCGTVISGLGKVFESHLRAWLNARIETVLEGVLESMQSELRQHKEEEMQRLQREIAEVGAW